MLVEMTKREVIELWNSITDASMGKHCGVKFGYAISKTTNNIKPVIRELERKQTEKPDSMRVFDEARIELCKEYADRDKHDNPIKEGPNFKIVERLEEFEEAFANLQKEHEKAFEDQKEHLEAFDKHLEEKIEVDLHMIPQSNIPETITVKEMRGLFVLIADPDAT